MVTQILKFFVLQRRLKHRMKFIIRDDDLNYFSKPEHIEEWYGDIFAQHIPVGFATVPFVLPLKKILSFGYKNVELKEYPISENKELIQYAKSNSLIEILLHGYTHEVESRKYEYGAGAKLQELIGKTIRGKLELEKVFGCLVKVFVPPHDQIVNVGIKAIENSGLNIIRGKGSKNFLMRKEYFLIFPQMVLRRLRYLRTSCLPAYPYVLNFGKHEEAFSYRLNDDNLQELISGLKYASKNKGNFIITAHINSYNKKKKENLTRLIELARELKAEFVYPRDLFINE